MSNLLERHKHYKEISRHHLMPRVPVIIEINGCSFARLTKDIVKPFDSEFLDVLVYTAAYVASEIQGCVFAYTWADKFIFVLRNDQTLESQPWYDNDVQKICSTVTSITTGAFYKCLANLAKGLPLNGDAFFETSVFTVPSITETANYLVAEQKKATRFAVSMSSRVEIQKELGKKITLSLLEGKNSDEKIALLNKHCNIKFEEYYPCSFRMGTAIYKVPTVVPGREGYKNKWQINWNTFSFVNDMDALTSIISTGHDVFKSSSIFGD